MWELLVYTLAMFGFLVAFIATALIGPHIFTLLWTILKLQFGRDEDEIDKR